MNAEDRVKAVSEFGFSERQAGFLVTVMQHAGVCVPRQYARFAGTAYGQLVNAFFDKLVHDGFAIRCDCVHNRARVYRLHHKPLYRAIGEVDSRYRRPVPAGRVMERLMRLDGVLEGSSAQHLVWLTSEDEKVAFFSAIAPSFPRDRLPRAVVGSGSSKRVRLFPDLTPVGVETTGRVVFHYVAIGAVNDEFRAFLYRHGDLLRALPGWTVRFLVPRHLPQLGAAYEAAFRDELARPISPRAIAELKWYFEQRRLGDERARACSDSRFWQAQRIFAIPRYSVLYRQWITDGEHAIELVSTPAVSEALARGTGRVETVVMPFSYRHLSPLVSVVRSAASEVEEGEDGATRSQPPPLNSTTDTNDTASDSL